ncbi:MAG: signal recognition particle protein [Nitrososphaerota archaeon]
MRAIKTLVKAFNCREFQAQRMLSELRAGLARAIERLLSSTTPVEQAIEEFSKDVQRSLLLADVAVEQVARLTRDIENKVRKEKLPPGISLREHAIRLLYEKLVSLLGGEGTAHLNIDPREFNIIMLVGLEGSGKTTTAAKLARWFQKRGYKVGLVCADTYRPGAYEQLKSLVAPVGIPVYWLEGSSAEEIAKAGTKHFRDMGYNVVVVDTAGRHKEERSLMMEVRALNEAIKPTLTFLVIDAAMGQQSAAQAIAFNQAVGLGGIVVTKLDGTAKGGGALSAVAAIGAKIYFVCSGDRLDDLEVFDAKRFAARLLGLGDLEALLQRVKEASVEEEDQEKYVKKMLSGRFTLDDLLREIQRLGKMGPLRKLLELLPIGPIGGGEINIDDIESRLKVWKSVINSMTPQERENPDIIDGRRIRRIASGSGRDERAVKELLEYYKRTRQLLRSNRGRLIKMLSGQRLSL